jgi:O-antigen ligase
MAAAMVFVPLYRTGILEDSFLTPKLLAVQLFGLAAGLSLLFQKRSSADSEGGVSGVRSASVFSCRYPAFWLVAFLLWATTSLFYARSHAWVITSLAYWLSFVVVHLACCVGLRGSQQLGRIFSAGFAATVAIAAWTLWEDLARHSNRSLVARLPDWRGYLAAGLGNSGHIAGFMGLFLCWGLLRFLTASPRARLAYGFGLACLACAFIVTWSVGSAAATIAGVALWGVITFAGGVVPKAALRRIGVLIFVGAAAAALYFCDTPLNPHKPSLWTEAFGSNRWEEGWPTRIAIWLTTLAMIKSSPILGVGSGNFTLEFVRQNVPELTGDPSLARYAGAFTNDAHNEYLQIWSEQGIVGLALYLAVLVTFFRQLARSWKVADLDGKKVLIAAGSGVTVLLLDSLMTFPLRLPAHIFALMVFLAVPRVLSYSSGNDDMEKHPHRSRLLGGILALLACMALIVHGRRVAAEYYLKQGRGLIESSAIMLGGRPTSSWSAAEMMIQTAEQQLADGNTTACRELMARASSLAQDDVFEQTKALFQKSLRADSRYSNARSRMASLLLMRGDYGEAAANLRAALRDLESVEIWERLGLAEYMLGHYPEARAAWTTAEHRRPSTALYFHNLSQQADRAAPK